MFNVQNYKLKDVTTPPSNHTFVSQESRASTEVPVNVLLDFGWCFVSVVVKFFERNAKQYLPMYPLNHI